LLFEFGSNPYLLGVFGNLGCHKGKHALNNNELFGKIGWNNANQLMVFATYGTTSTSGCHVGLITCLKDVPILVNIHCITHWKALVANEFKSMLEF
jgi:hypothetical protein